ncbi:MAG: LacI family transcriptional regulator [Meiothermus sp.]|uniref:LacI family DNA-binding transcriptional regulator n=1 Tax=Meiothermus sp. TaxID=1955249 RepID=UPI0025FD6EEB|nr:LacI family DNA-binding transcriptional regulator [Meiothermus sp.]MCS7058811.1 LacI family transcriptional regulator [Meiothermus sp.]MCS7194660.1 LacI family transcriptional regulator [Meiothermus sp.]
MRKAVRIFDVAREAGVSPGTVSKVLNGTQRMAADTEARVWKAVSKLGYQANWHARILSTGRSEALGVVILDILNPHFTALVKGASRVASNQGYTVLLADAEEDPGRELNLIQSLRARTDGLILAGSRLSDQQIASLHSPEQPIVTVGRRIPGVPSVTVDEYTASLQLTGHLVAQGCRRIVYLAGPPFWVNQERERGYQDALTQAGLPPQVFRLASPDLLGGEQASALLWTVQPFPDGVICYNDLVAIGLMASLRTLGVRVPQDVAVAAFGNHPLAAHLSPGLTHMEIPSRKLGELATDLLVELLKKPQEASHVQQYAVLRPRGSTQRLEVG